jgi:hypothetical protein
LHGEERLCGDTHRSLGTWCALRMHPFRNRLSSKSVCPQGISTLRRIVEPSLSLKTEASQRSKKGGAGNGPS